MTQHHDDLPKITNDAYAFGVIYAKLQMIKDDLLMGNQKESLTKVNDVMKFLETNIISEYYKQPALKDEGIGS